MLIQKNIENILFLDVETAPLYPSYEDLPEKMKKLWTKKAEYFLQNKPELKPSDIYERAGIYSEFGKIICVSVGYVTEENGVRKIRLKSFYDKDEKMLLLNFANLLNKHYKDNDKTLCAHNGKEFDFPFIARRMLINGIQVPDILNTPGKKPWEVNLLDTMELWKFGDYKNYTSLELLAAVFDIPTPKDDIDGSQVCHVYWVEKDLERIVKYCQKDVVAIIQLFLRYQGEPLIDEAQQIIL
ncbi:MAG: ribonuclease H-like domain-containing protein [Bacteroidales bacterium]|nr:ribonuclease H-like domain-containing protein [Bacteroidales bacterium]